MPSNNFDKLMIAIIICCVGAFFVTIFLDIQNIKYGHTETSVVVCTYEGVEKNALSSKKYGEIYLENHDVLYLKGYPDLYPNGIKKGDTITYKPYNRIVSIKKFRPN